MSEKNKGPYSNMGAGKTITEWGNEMEAANGRPPGVVAEIVFGQPKTPGEALFDELIASKVICSPHDYTWAEDMPDSLKADYERAADSFAARVLAHFEAERMATIREFGIGVIAENIRARKADDS